MSLRYAQDWDEFQDKKNQLEAKKNEVKELINKEERLEHELLQKRRQRQAKQSEVDDDRTSLKEFKRSFQAKRDMIEEIYSQMDTAVKNY